MKEFQIMDHNSCVQEKIFSSGYRESNAKMHPNRDHLPYKEAVADSRYNYH